MPIAQTPWQKWTDHVRRWKDCTKCPLYTQRNHIVLARGSIPADVVFVGEAPGTSENDLGQPFIGPAGKLLDQIIERAWRSITDTPTFALTNLVACFPRESKEAGTNEPDVAEIKACQPRLAEFIDLCSPKLLVAVGGLADTHLAAALPAKTVLSAGGRVEGHKSLVYWTSIVHPAHIVRAPLAQQGMMLQKAVVVLSNALEEMYLPF